MTESGTGCQQSTPQLEVARAFLAAGISFIPIRTDGSKAPDGRALPLIPEDPTNPESELKYSWDPFKDSPPTLDEAEAWFAAGASRGIAVVAGKVSGNRELIDFDDIAIYDQWKTVVDEAMPGLVDSLTRNRTPRPGMHVIYRCSEISGNTKLAQRPEQDPQGKWKPKTIIETRGEGGYFLAPGCPAGCHELGRLYEHVAGPPLTEAPIISPEQRECLWAAARSFHAWVEEKAIQNGPAYERNGALRPGDDFNQHGLSWQEIIGPHGWEEVSPGRWRRPGKQMGWSATTGFCRTQDGQELFAVFSSNAHPFEVPVGKVCGCYSKFAAYALLNHGGDFKAAAKDLAKQGYGEKTAPAHTSGKRPTAYDIILEHFRKEYAPTFRRDNSLYSGSQNRVVKASDACFAPGKELVEKLRAASDAPRSDGRAKRGTLPPLFRKWAPSAWHDLLRDLPEEPDAQECSDFAEEEFRSRVAKALLTLVAMGHEIKTRQSETESRPEEKTQVERRSLIDWCKRWAKPGPWKSIRSYCLWTTLSEGRLRVAMKFELFGQINQDWRDLGKHKFARLCERYMVGKASEECRPGGCRAIELDPDFIAELESEIAGLPVSRQ
jgi:putative DNA primase/helicase